MGSVSASFKAEVVRKDSYKSNIYFTGASVVANIYISPGLDRTHKMFFSRTDEQAS